MGKAAGWKKWLVIGIAGAVAIAAIVLLVIGVSRHVEPVLLTVCWDEEGVARYIDDEIEGHNEAESCSGSEELVWATKQIPITISTISTLDDGEPGIFAEDDPRHRVLDQTIRDLNRELGFELFVRRPAGTTPVSGWVHFGQGIEARQAGDSERTTPPGRVSHRREPDGSLDGHVYVRSDVESSDRLLYCVLRHELLHLAGLAHDSFTASIMYPFTRDDSIEGPMSTAHVTDRDRARLRDLYANVGRGRP